MENGPDQVVPAPSLKTWTADGAVQIQMDRSEAGSKSPISVHTMLRQVAEKHPHQRALAVDQDGGWKYYTYSEYFRESCIVAKAFIALGLDRLRGVCIMGFNSPEWVFANFGGIFAGGISTGIYTTNSPDACKHLAFDSRSQILVLENQAYVDKFMKVRDQLPEVKVIIQWCGVPQEGVMSWSALLALGQKQTDVALKQRLRLQAVNQCCTLIYTSGTTGPPKGVMCSQDNFTWVGREHGKRVQMKECAERLISYLPLSHMAAQIIDIYVPIPLAGTIYFARPDVLKGSLGTTLTKVMPTCFFGVPRVWEKMQEGIAKAGANSGKVTKAVAGWARDKALRYHRATMNNTSYGFLLSIQYWLAKNFVLSTVKHKLGMNSIFFLLSAGAPISVDILDFFMSLDLPIVNGYGMSENLSVGTMASTLPGMMRSGSVGKVVYLTELSLRKNDLTNPHIAGEGEICFKGRNIFMGYLDMPEKTNETITDDGWMMSGDLGWVDDDGFVYISGRAKELVITAGGENIPPILIEDAVKDQLPLVSNAMLCGDARKYLTILLTIKSEMDPGTGAPLDTLAKSVVKWCEERGVTVGTVTELREHLEDMQSPIAKAIDEGIAKYNREKAISNAQKVQRWRVLEHDFSLATGELNSTLKLKRSVTAKMYSKDIDIMYRE